MEHEQNRAFARRNEKMLAGANAAIERDAEHSGDSRDELTHLLCECAEACGHSILMSFNEWDAIHRHELRFMVGHGHEAPAVEWVVERNDRYLVVEKFPLSVPK